MFGRRAYLFWRQRTPTSTGRRCVWLTDASTESNAYCGSCSGHMQTVSVPRHATTASRSSMQVL